MELNELIIAIVGVSTFGSIAKAYIDYKQKAIEARLEKMKSPDEQLRSDIAELNRKLTELRDVTTQYDMSFDSALHRVESRLSVLEQKNLAGEDSAGAVRITR